MVPTTVDIVSAVGPAFKRKRKAENQHAPTAKKTVVPRRELEAYFTRACSVQGPIFFCHAGAAGPSNMSNVGPNGDDASSEDVHTDDESYESCSSDAGGGRASPSPPVFWNGNHGAMMGGFASPGLPHPVAGVCDPRECVAGLVAPVATRANVGTTEDPMSAETSVRVSRDVRLEVDEWGWFVDAGDEELRMATPSR